MDRIFALVGRFFWIVVGFILASYAAGGFLTLTTGVWRNFVGLQHGFMDPGDTVVGVFETVLVVGVTGSLIGRAFFLPAAVAIAAAEIFRLRSAVAHLLGGVAVAFVAGYAGHFLPEVHGGMRRSWELLLATGVVAGGVYWLVAGMRSGAWHGSPDAPEPTDRRDPGGPDTPS